MAPPGTIHPRRMALNYPKIHRCAVVLALASLCACAGLKDAGDCTGSFRPIHEVQGPAASSPLAGERVTVRGVMVGDFRQRDQLGGFFLQDLQTDDDPRTSEGIFVFAPRAAGVSRGDLVQVSGKVAEYSDLTELTDVETIAVCRPGEAPAPIPLSLTRVDALEPYEGMLVTLAGDLTVASTHELGAHGQLLLAAGGRPFKGTNGQAAAGAGGRPPEGGRMGRRLLVDDGSRIEGPSPPPYLDPAGTRRVGDTVTGLIGVMSEQQGIHVLHPTVPPQFTGANPRTAAPPPVGGTIRVASFNLFNFFTTLGERGASDTRELERQRAKHVAALSSLDADVVGLSELENNGEAAIRDLADALNAAAGEDLWAHVPAPTGGLGDDVIRVGLIYRPGAVRPVGPPRVDRHPVFKRPPFAQTFEAHGEHFTVVVNHFKSKSCRQAEGPESDAGTVRGVGIRCGSDRHAEC